MKRYEESVKVTREALLLSIGAKRKEDLISAWVLRYPLDKNAIDLEQMALGGYVEMRGGYFLPFVEWQAFVLDIKKQRSGL